VGVEALLELGFVLDACFLGPLRVAVGRQRRLVFERGVVELPESVVAGQREDALRGLGCRLRVLVEGKRIILPDEANLVLAIGLLDLVDRRFDARAERALKIAENDHGDRGGAAAPDRVLAVDGDRRLVVRPGQAGVGRQGVIFSGVIDAIHQAHPCQKAQDEADDGRSFVHHIR
jgi:hypothetical protein